MTFWSSNENYGQLLQLFSTTQVLTKLGFDPYVIQYDGVSDKTLNRFIIKRFMSLFLHPSKIVNKVRAIRNSPSKYIQDNKQRRFDDFRNQRLQWTKKFNNFAELEKDSPDFRAYITGSDMVWSNPKIGKPYFLHFGGENIKRIAFAASFGVTDISHSYKKQLPYWLERFDYISTREDSARIIVEKATDKEVRWLPDPTLLLKGSDFLKIATDKIDKSEKYIFAYILGNGIKLTMDEVSKFSMINNIGLKYTSAHERNDDYPKIYPTIEEWIELVSKSEYIVTNSFHGVAFSIIFHKRFLYVPIYYNGGANNERAKSLLTKLGLSDRIWNYNLNKIKDPIDYDRIEDLLSIWRIEAENYLNKALV